MSGPKDGGAPLMIPLRTRGKLSALSKDAYGVIHKVWHYVQDLGYPGRLHVDELPAATDRLWTKGQLDKAIAELMRAEFEHRDGTVEKLWIDRDGDHLVLPPWWIEENPPAGVSCTHRSARICASRSSAVTGTCAATAAPG